MLSAEEITAYHAQGYTLVEGAVAPALLAEINRIVDDFVAQARGVTANNEVYDLETTHTPEAPRVRRLKEPVERHPLFWELVRSPGVIGPVTQLLGPDLRLHGSKLNMKAAGYGAAVEWHQDWAFYPHTNDDLLAVGVMLDDVALENGPLMVVPGSHRGKIYDHHHDGYFHGAVNLAVETPDLASAVTLTAKAGSMSIHHVRMLHGSAVNRSSSSEVDTSTTATGGSRSRPTTATGRSRPSTVKPSRIAGLRSRTRAYAVARLSTSSRPAKSNAFCAMYTSASPA